MILQDASRVPTGMVPKSSGGSLPATLSHLTSTLPEDSRVSADLRGSPDRFER
jgi:hypothetical protein